ncbi:MAG: hypothetical protein ABIJ00_08045 [Candidatus Eisenbacteria bacterium]
MRLKTLFVGLPRARVQKVVSSVEAASSLRLGVTVCSDPGDRLGELVSRCDAVFMNRHIDDARLDLSLSAIREHRDDVPVTLVYESEPDGKAFVFARKYDCWLFSENDRRNRTLTPAEVGEGLLRESARDETKKRLMEISFSTGPCSTGE